MADRVAPRARVFSLAFSLSISLALAAPARAAAPELVTRTKTAMGTDVRISVLTDDEEGALRAIAAAFDEIDRLEAMMTTWRSESEVSQVNAAAGKRPVKVSPEVIEVLKAARRASELSGGAFDVTFYALRGLWKFDEDLEKKLPDDKSLKARLPLIDYRQVVIDEPAGTVMLGKPGMAINLGGIAKGYAVDKAAAILKRAGFGDAIVQAGGDLLCSGSKGGKPWTAGIRDPRGDRSDAFALLALTDHAFSTAGDYERYFILDGKRYHHILDPKTGQPARRSRSVTLYAPTALLADALDDAVFILGWQKGFALLEKVPDTGAVVVDEKGEVHISPRIRDKVKILHPPTGGP
jgi:thiamine biosynthesis lipoprotein